jgi:hypothetical protein
MALLEHSPIGASSSERWFNCPGSVKLIATVPPQPSSAYAEEGTKAHAYAAEWLITGKFNPALLDDPEMYEAVAEYVRICDGFRHKTGAVHLVEKRFDLSAVYPGCFGTCDFMCYWPDHKLLIVVDFKYGAGVYVDPVKNSQLMYYGLGAYREANQLIEKIELGIVQPRCGDGKYRSWTIDTMDLLDFKNDLIAYATATAQPDAPFKAGGWCRFCPAAAVCPELQQETQITAQMEFAPIAPALFSYDPKDLAKALTAIPKIEAWVKRVNEFAYGELEAGREIPGYKLVDKKPRRKWKDETAAKHHLKAAGYSDAQIFEDPKLKSPAQMEKTLAGAKGLLDGLFDKASSGHTIAPLSDPRPAVHKTTAQEDFAVIETTCVVDPFA